MANETQQGDLRLYQELLDRGHDLAWTGNWEEAATLYRRAIEMRSDDPDAYIDLGLALYESGRFSQALDAYKGALRADPTNVNALKKIAEIYAKQGDKLKAASTYLMLADGYMQARQPIEAVRAWQQVVRYDPMNRVAYRRLADAYSRGRRNDLAAQATIALARVYSEEGDKQAAIQLAEEAIDLQPDFTPAHQLLAMLQDSPTTQAAVGTGHLSGTRGLRGRTGLLRRGSTTGPLDMDILELDNVEEARVKARPEREETGPSPAELAQQRALARLAEAFFEGESVDLTIEALKAKAIDLQTRGLVDEAARTFEDIIDAGGESEDVYFALGSLYKMMLRFDDAIEVFERVVESKEYSMAAYFSIGQCYQSQGRADEARLAFHQALDALDLRRVEYEQVDEVIAIYEGLADAYEAKGDREQAEHFTNVLAEFLATHGWDDKLREVHARMGVVGVEGFGDILESENDQAVLAAIEAAKQYHQKHRVRGAIDELYSVLTLAPYYLPLHLLLADLYLEDGRPEDAVAKLVMVAEVYLARANLSQGIQVLNRALEIAPTDQNVRGRVIDLSIKHGEIDAALKHYLQLADGFYQLAQGERAIEKLNEALRLAPRGNPDNAWGLQIQRRLGDMHMQRLDWRRATTAFEAIHSARPDDLDVAQQLISLYYRQGADDRALGMLETTSDRLFELKGPQETLKFLQAQSSQRPEDVKLLDFIGKVYQALEDPEMAAKVWERAVELWVRQGETVQAAALLRRMIALHTRQEKRYRAMLDHLLKQ